MARPTMPLPEGIQGAALRADKPAAASGWRAGITIEPRAVCSRLLAVMGMLLLANLVVIALAARLSAGRQDLVVRAFLFDSERNLPTLFSVALLAGSSLVCVLLALRDRERGGRWQAHWLGAAALLFLVMFDEAARVHERLIEPLRGALGFAGPLYFAWVVPGALLVAALGVAYARFVWAMAPVRALLVAAATLYVGGALGIELIGGMEAERAGVGGTRFLLVSTVEESLEMLGLIVFLYAGLRLLAYPASACRLDVRCRAF